MKPSETSVTSTLVGYRDVLSADQNSYSTLEVHHGRFVEDDRHAPPFARPESGTGKFVSYDKDCQKEMVVSCAPEMEGTTFAAQNSKTRQFHGKILGIPRRRFFLGLGVVLLVLIAAALGGGLGGAAATRKHEKAQSVDQPNTSNNDTSLPSNENHQRTNTGLAVMQWTDPDGTLHKQVYYQGDDNVIRESTWKNTSDFSSAWTIQKISEPAKPRTPIAAVAGWPHASQNYTLVKNVYYMNNSTELVERQAKADNPSSWEDDNFTGLFRGSNTTFISAYWGQNIWNSSQQLVVLFQRDNFENGITQAKYTSNNISLSNPWVANNFPFAQPKGSNFAMALVSYRSGRHLMLYTIGDNGKLDQNEYTINDNIDSTSVVSLTSQSSTPLTLDPKSPLAVVAQDNQPLFNATTLSECYQNTPLTNLIIYSVPDRSSLKLSSWNCTTGFLDKTDEILPLQKPKTTFLALAAMSDRVTGDGNIYIMFDSGDGTQIEEWTVPKRAGQPWTISRKVTI